MRVLRFVSVAAVVAAASAFVAMPASAQGQSISCPQDGGLRLVKTASKADYNVNDIVTFTLKVHADYCDATGVSVHDLLPPGLTVSDPSVLNHSFGSLPAGGEKSFSFPAAAVAKGKWTNKADASGYSVGPDEPSSLCLRIVRPPLPVNQAVSPNAIRTIPPIQLGYTCPKSSHAEVTIDVTAPSGTNPNPPPPPGKPGRSDVPLLPNTGRQG
jgi:uncharacterized repeat protein (TIGR01451 family)